MEEREVTTETKPQFERLSELNCFPSYSQGKAITHTRSLGGSHPNDPRVDQSKGDPLIPQPTPSHRAKERGQLEKTRKIKQNTKTQGFQSEIRQAVWTCYFFCGEVQKSNVIIANDMLWRPESPLRRLPFKVNRNESLHFFAYSSLFFPPPIHLTFPYLYNSLVLSHNLRERKITTETPKVSGCLDVAL